MRALRSLLFLSGLLLSPALAGGAEPLPAWARELFIGQRLDFAPGTVTVPFTVEADFSRTRAWRGGPPQLFVTFVDFGGRAFNLDSRAFRPGEKVRWEGRLPAEGTLVIRVVDDAASAISTENRRPAKPVRLVITGDERGSWGVSDGVCPPRTSGICGGR